jgi:hypothetical protein
MNEHAYCCQQISTTLKEIYALSHAGRWTLDRTLELSAGWDDDYIPAVEELQLIEDYFTDAASLIRIAERIAAQLNALVADLGMAEPAERNNHERKTA